MTQLHFFFYNLYLRLPHKISKYTQHLPLSTLSDSKTQGYYHRILNLLLTIIIIWDHEWPWICAWKIHRTWVGTGKISLTIDQYQSCYVPVLQRRWSIPCRLQARDRAIWKTSCCTANAATPPPLHMTDIIHGKGKNPRRLAPVLSQGLPERSWS